MDERAPHGGTPEHDRELEALRRELERVRALTSDDGSLLAAILEHSPHGIIIADASGRLALQNRAAERIWAGSATADDVASWQQYRAFHPDGRPFEASDWGMARSLATREVLEARELHIRRFDGTPGVLLASSAPLLTAGKLTGAITVFADISRLKESEAEAARLRKDIARSEARLRALVDATAAIVWNAEPDGRIVEVSGSWLVFTGQTSDDFRDGGYVNAIHPDDREAALCAWRDAVARQQKYTSEYRLRRRDGSYAHTLARGTPVRAGDGSVLEYVGCNIDVSEQRRAEASAHEHAEMLAQVNELGRLINAELDTQKLVQAVTDAATALTGAAFGAFFYNMVNEQNEAYTLYTISGVPHEAFSKFPMPRDTAIFAATFAEKRVVRSDDITRDPAYGRSAPHHGMPTGHLPVRSYLAVPVVSRGGVALGAILLGHPEPGVFARRSENLVSGLAAQAAVAMDNARLFLDAERLIARLEQSNRELDQFAYVASHDLKAPLRGMAHLAQWVEEDLGDAATEDVRHKLSLLRGRAQRMEGLIQGILAFSRAGRVERAQMEAVDTHKLALEVSELLAVTPPARVVITSALPKLHTDRVGLQQVLMNLVGNALKHAERADVSVMLSAAHDDGVWTFSVADDGPGIAPEFHERVWGIFQTLAPRDKVESTGIGLAIVKKIVEGRGGRAWITRADTGGARFCFSWPEHETS